MVCIYHSRDCDGYASGAIVKYWHDKVNDYPDNVGKGELTLIGYDYKEPIPYDKIPKGEPIIMVDVSLDMPDMCELANYSGNQLTWIDHHISAINDYKNFVGDGESFLKPVLENGISACEGTWNYLFPVRKMPEAIHLLGEYDTWRNKDKERWENIILPFQFGMRLYCNSAETFPVHLFDNNQHDIDTIIKHGNVVLQYQRQVNEIQCKKAFEFDFHGLRAICLNGGGFNSDVFKSVYDGDKHDIMMPFQFSGKFWNFSIYSVKPEIDCSVIAKKHGGGGHAGASGFQIEDITEIFPFLKK